MSTTYPAPPDCQVDPDGKPPPSDQDADDQYEAELVFNRSVSEEVNRQRVRAEASRRMRAGATPEVPDVVTLAGLLDEPDEVVQWRVHGLLPAGGRVILAAQRKAGKTTMIGNLLRVLVDGGRFLDQYGVNPAAGRVAVLDFEMPRGALRRWLRDQDVQHPDGVALWVMRGRASAFDILDPAVRSAWAERLRAVDASVLVLDCLRPILDSLGLDENHDAGRFLVAVDALLNEAGIGEAIIVHHIGHNGERSRGDSRLRDWPDAEWRLMRQDVDEPGKEAAPDAQRFFAAEGRDVAVAESLVEFDPDTRRLSLVGGSRKEARGDRIVPALLDLIAGTAPEGLPGWSGRAIEGALVAAGHGQKDVRAAVKRAVDSRAVVIIDGPRRARLHVLSKASASVRRSASDALTHSGSECVSASIGDALHSLPTDHDQSECVTDALEGVS